MKRKRKINRSYLWGMYAFVGVVGFVVWVGFALGYRNYTSDGEDNGASWTHSPIHWFTFVVLGVIVIPVIPTLIVRACRFLKKYPIIERKWTNSPDLRREYKK